jgi:nicotinate phosphoribosyltransferase
VVTGSGAPTASMVYKLVEVDGIPVEKRSSHKESHGGRKQALRLAKPSGTIIEEIVHPFGRPPVGQGLSERCLTVPFVRAGSPLIDDSLEAARGRVRSGLLSLPWDGLKLSKGEPAVPTRMIAPDPGRGG